MNGQNARVYEDGNFESLTNVGPGAQTINVQATDTNGNTTTQNWQVNNGPANGAVPTHDIEGNLLTDGTYTGIRDARNCPSLRSRPAKWLRFTDTAITAKQCMTSVTKGTDTWTLQYDGQPTRGTEGRQSAAISDCSEGVRARAECPNQNRRISESKNGRLVRQFIWNGTRVMEEHLPQGSRRQYWTDGMDHRSSSNQQTEKRFFIHDHLGSLRAVIVTDVTSTAPSANYDYSSP